MTTSAHPIPAEPGFRAVGLVLLLGSVTLVAAFLLADRHVAPRWLVGLVTALVLCAEAAACYRAQWRKHGFRSIATRVLAPGIAMGLFIAFIYWG